MALKFQAVFTRLQMKIIGGEWGDGSQIPTEMELCTQYGVSRVTIRRALKGLVSNGYIARTRGKGSFVLSQRELIGASEVKSHPDFPQVANAYQYKILLSEKIAASPTDNKLIGLLSGSTWPMLWHFKVLGAKNGIPAVLSDYYVCERFKDVYPLGQPCLSISFFESMYQVYGQKCHFRRGAVAAVVSNEEICEVLQTKPGSANLWCRGICVLEDGTVIGRCTNIFNGSLYEFAVENDIEAAF
ncbi:transcriptional regulator [Sphaerochaeta pleomorpha str. Grapes]|uniref:Transcriptional regulator n=1 Tax=Sphaerochaeta pleomorpha (strain ATCC BAA-1885 / DSM 22778 / Grapes) TaxID=158190 RepID=G8QSM0_SPHPG|nr:GntR family transcriptional regulator [Sphaerochaeta pleomorpha]AEV28981.1 transcriptional regulator [Sphaerochaeta pleomorpha str. Grapes]